MPNNETFLLRNLEVFVFVLFPITWNFNYSWSSHTFLPHSAFQIRVSPSQQTITEYILCIRCWRFNKMNEAQYPSWSWIPLWTHWFEISVVLLGGVVQIAIGYSDWSSVVASECRFFWGEISHLVHGSLWDWNSLPRTEVKSDELSGNRRLWNMGMPARREALRKRSTRGPVVRSRTGLCQGAKRIKGQSKSATRKTEKCSLNLKQRKAHNSCLETKREMW